MDYVLCMRCPDLLPDQTQILDCLVSRRYAE